MRPKRYSSEGIILARRNYSEADRILIVFSKHYGKISLLAKSVRKPESRKRGSLEIFSHIRFSAATGKNLDLITEVEMINSFDCLRNDLKKVSVAYYFMEVVGRVTRDDEKNEALYKLILESLNNLRPAERLKEFRLKFVYDVLVLLGFWPKDRPMDNPDIILEDVVERELSSARVGKKLLT
jgi:DNA repair protein RecO (recombination protein O)